MKLMDWVYVVGAIFLMCSQTVLGASDIVIPPGGSVVLDGVYRDGRFYGTIRTFYVQPNVDLYGDCDEGCFRTGNPICAIIADKITAFKDKFQYVFDQALPGDSCDQQQVVKEDQNDAALLNEYDVIIQNDCPAAASKASEAENSESEDDGVMVDAEDCCVVAVAASAAASGDFAQRAEISYEQQRNNSDELFQIDCAIQEIDNEIQKELNALYQTCFCVLDKVARRYNDSRQEDACRAVKENIEQLETLKDRTYSLTESSVCS